MITLIYPEGRKVHRSGRLAPEKTAWRNVVKPQDMRSLGIEIMW
jgi:hypothetical protein